MDVGESIVGAYVPTSPWCGAVIRNTFHRSAKAVPTN
jgi:hypothetical protein